MDIQTNIGDTQHDYNTSDGNVSSKKNKDIVNGFDMLEKKVIMPLISITPKEAIKPITKLSYEITKDFISESEEKIETWEIDVNPNGKKETITKVSAVYKDINDDENNENEAITKNVAVYNDEKLENETITKITDVYDDENVELSIKKNFTPYDREVHDAVISLYEAGNKHVTPATVYRMMNGLTGSEYVTKAAIKKVRVSLEKSRRIEVTIFCEDEVDLYKDKHKVPMEIEYTDYMFNSKIVTVTVNKKIKQRAYFFQCKPILFEYAQISGQIMREPINLLNTTNKVNNTPEVTVLRGHLLKQIHWMKKHNRSKNITYESMYELLGVAKDKLTTQMYKLKTHKTRKHISSILEEWVEQKYIKSFKAYPDGKIKTGITIILYPENNKKLPAISANQIKQKSTTIPAISANQILLKNASTPAISTNHTCNKY